MPFLGHNPYDGLDVSPDGTPAVRQGIYDDTTLARRTVHRFAVDADDEAMLVELLGLTDEPTATGQSDDRAAVADVRLVGHTEPREQESV